MSGKVEIPCYRRGAGALRCNLKTGHEGPCETPRPTYVDRCMRRWDVKPIPCHEAGLGHDDACDCLLIASATCEQLDLGHHAQGVFSDGCPCVAIDVCFNEGDLLVQNHCNLSAHDLMAGAARALVERWEGVSRG